MRKLPPTKIWTLALALGALVFAAAPALADDEDDNGGLDPAPGGVVRNFFIDLNNISWEIRPGVDVDIWAFSAGPGTDPTIPGPLIRVNKGDLVRVHFRNTHARPHTLHFHGFHPVRFDGVRATFAFLVNGFVGYDHRGPAPAPVGSPTPRVSDLVTRSTSSSVDSPFSTRSKALLCNERHPHSAR